MKIFETNRTSVPPYQVFYMSKQPACTSTYQKIKKILVHDHFPASRLKFHKPSQGDTSTGLDSTILHIKSEVSIMVCDSSLSDSYFLFQIR